MPIYIYIDLGPAVGTHACIGTKLGVNYWPSIYLLWWFGAATYDWILPLLFVDLRQCNGCQLIVNFVLRANFMPALCLLVVSLNFGAYFSTNCS